MFLILYDYNKWHWQLGNSYLSNLVNSPTTPVLGLCYNGVHEASVSVCSITAQNSCLVRNKFQLHFIQISALQNLKRALNKTSYYIFLLFVL